MMSLKASTWSREQFYRWISKNFHLFAFQKDYVFVLFSQHRVARCIQEWRRPKSCPIKTQFSAFFVPTFKKVDSAPKTRQSEDSEYVHKP